MKLWELLQKIQNNNRLKANLSGNSNGRNFEEALKDYLVNNGDYAPYPANALKRHRNYERLKEILNNKAAPELKIETNILNDICVSNPQIIYQPLGSQMYPDFLLVRRNYIIPFEIKFSTKSGDTPTWNSNLPHNSGIYIFGSKGRQDITFFNGADYLTTEEKAKFVELVNAKTIELAAAGAEITDKFTIYLREMYNQKISSLNHPKRIEFENKAIDLLKEIENSNN